MWRASWHPPSCARRCAAKPGTTAAPVPAVSPPTRRPWTRSVSRAPTAQPDRNAQPVKPAPFRYADPGTLDEALEVLSAEGEGAKVLAGGQSLLPLLSMRLAAPATLVDI